MDYWCRNCKNRFVPIEWRHHLDKGKVAVCAICRSTATEPYKEPKKSKSKPIEDVIKEIIKEPNEFIEDPCDKRPPKMCFCIGPDKCGDPCCPQVRAYRRQNREIFPFKIEKFTLYESNWGDYL